MNIMFLLLLPIIILSVESFCTDELSSIISFNIESWSKPYLMVNKRILARYEFKISRDK